MLQNLQIYTDELQRVAFLMESSCNSAWTFCLTPARNACCADVTAVLIIFVEAKYSSRLDTRNTQGSKAILPQPPCQALSGSPQCHLGTIVTSNELKWSLMTAFACIDEQTVVSLSSIKRRSYPVSKERQEFGSWDIGIRNLLPDINPKKLLFRSVVIPIPRNCLQVSILIRMMDLVW